MARVLVVAMQNLHFLPASLTFFIVLTAVLSVFSAVAFLCGSHGGERKKTVVRLGGKSKLESRLSRKTVWIGKMISWRKVEEQEKEEEVVEDGGAVWKKTIIKGEKCRPLDFSGRILYDSDGNVLPE